MSLSRRIARPMLASVFLVGATNALRDSRTVAAEAAPTIDRLVATIKRTAPQLPLPEDPETLVRLNAAVQIAAGTTFATGRAPRTSAAVLAGSLVVTTVAGHPFWKATDPQTRKKERLEFVKNASTLGGLLIAAGDTEGRPGVAWRARRAAKDARRETKHLAATARREARLVKAKVG
ncbi:DoxX family protein [Nocardioides marmotae]|uniref:DoxX family membrane protein n=1 Tax=Nocardioides marmotae TaxID=2663857 RepID=A0A6I3JAW4_9ACTN|nr:DoxX family protein [Nocardioides marmotae]MCR6031615.1 DoxX family membrane protein [Gordonia jinghuaiqii]MBC9733227.1 DoxX family protein [Nocardioides marmotae]MTB84338.1 DoxX family membrane protein [Nocardioides marmotae]MTB95254.1 DoxX family membrane protein [Nocardioides marmotae]QKE02273.1 DoxX family protein [Nocardioides marmotae]